MSRYTRKQAAGNNTQIDSSSIESSKHGSESKQKELIGNSAVFISKAD